tara:strand:+ start:293 stop:1090 length:798 start_codon:yes stop_codon:yes gene_type:complete
MKNNYHCLKEVDVLLPIHYSNEEYLIESINSLLNQTLKPNIICLLNGMDRNSNIYYENILTNLSVNKIIICPVKGIPNALNYGINYCEGKYIARQDDDDFSNPERLLKQKIFLENNNVDIVGTNINLIDKYGNIIGFREYPTSNKKCKETLAYKSCFCHPSIMVKKSFFLKNKYPLISGEDYALWLKSYRNSTYSNYPEFLYNYRIHPGQVSKTNINYLFLKESKKIINKTSDKKEKIRLIIYLILTILKCLIKRRKINFNTELS